MDLTTTAAIAFALAAAGTIAFQIALAMGAPWGSYAMGGRFPDRFPAPMRVAAIVQAAFLGVLAVIVLSAAGLVLPAFSDAAPWLIWLPVGFSVLSLILNFITPSAGERRLWVPVALLMVVSSLAVALASA